MSIIATFFLLLLPPLHPESQKARIVRSQWSLINGPPVLFVYSPLGFGKDFKQDTKKPHIYDKIKYEFKISDEKIKKIKYRMKEMKQREHERRKEKLKLGARVLHKRHLVKSVTFGAGNQPCFCLELCSGQHKEGNKIR